MFNRTQKADEKSKLVESTAKKQFHKLKLSWKFNKLNKELEKYVGSFKSPKRTCGIKRMILQKKRPHKCSISNGGQDQK